MFNTNFFYSLIECIIPTTCLLCGCHSKKLRTICQVCSQLLPILPDHCQKCAHPLPVSNASSTLCGKCLFNPPAFDQVSACFPYAPPINSFIIRLKFKQQLIYGKMLGELMVDQCLKTWQLPSLAPDLIIPVPLFEKRLQKRGFNQALEIAKPISRALNIPIDTTGIQRTRPTLSQSALPARQRKLNVKGAFCTTTSYSQQTVVIIDDVVTTGETVAELAKTLKASGAKFTHVWCAARATR